MMTKKIYYWLFTLCFIWPLAFGCSSDDDSHSGRHTIDDIQLTENGAKSAVLFAIDKGNGLKLDPAIPSEITINAAKQIKGEGFSFSEAFNCKRLSEFPEYTTVKQWNTEGQAKEGASYWVRYQQASQVALFKLRIAYVDEVNVGVEYNAAASLQIENDNANVPLPGQLYVTGYEMPRLQTGLTYAEHTTQVNGKDVLNYAIEWNDDMKHARWAAYSFDATTGVKNVTRDDDAWAVDPQLPADMQVDNEWHKNDGFDRGHLCASDDRSFSAEANRQTFYYSNMSPQFNSFNGGYWIAFEQLLLSWVRKDKAFASIYDHIYVAKGGTLNKLLTNYQGSKPGGDGVLPATDNKGFTSKGLPVPQYYFMAVLAHRAGGGLDASAYQAIGFLVEHRDDYGYTFDHPLPRIDTKSYAMSIDALETETGIDFFCNLPDDVERVVEASCNMEAWTW